MTQIKDHIDSLTAVLVLADGTVPRVTVGTDYALSTLSSVFPQTLVNNIAFMFTNVLSPLHWNFSEETLPINLRNAPHFLLNNPIALQGKYFKRMNDQIMKKRRTEFHRAAKAAEPEALGALVSLFDWLDGLEPQSTKEITSLYEMSQAIDTGITNILAQTDQAVTQKAEIDKQTRKYRECSAVSFHLVFTRRLILMLVGRRTSPILSTTPSGSRSMRPASIISASSPTAIPRVLPSFCLPRFGASSGRGAANAAIPTAPILTPAISG